MRKIFFSFLSVYRQEERHEIIVDVLDDRKIRRHRQEDVLTYKDSKKRTDRKRDVPSVQILPYIEVERRTDRQRDLQTSRVAHRQT
jgi:hypothetical protein